MPTTADDVLDLCALIEDCGATPRLAGGWGVDALVGRQTREHLDLDVLVEADRVPVVLQTLQQGGYVVSTDWLPVRVELTHPDGPAVDVHPIAPDDRDGWWQHGLDSHAFHYHHTDWVTGSVQGRDVVVLSPAKQRELHGGYDPRPVDLHDLALLALLGEGGTHGD